jgi:hypothetical protein
LLKYTIYIFLIFIFSSCGNRDFRVLETSSQTGITVEAMYWKRLFSSSGAFELRLTNNSGQDYKNCEIILDEKFRHPLNGLHTREIGMIKDSVFRNGSQVTIYFSDEDSNILFFEGAESGFIPETIGVKCDECEGVWRMD